MTSGRTGVAAAAERRARTMFVLLWSAMLLVKLGLAAALAPFGDEAFYWQEGRHLAWAYSDLPGLTAWLARLGGEAAALIGADGGTLGLRWPFVAMGAALPWLIVRIAARWFGPVLAWRAGVLTLLFPLSGAMGLLALPDVPMTLAAALCLDAAASLLRRVSTGALIELALALAIGALSHYRFAAVIVAGLVGLLLVARGRALLRQPGLWLALAVGAAAWLPLAWWNLGHHGVGLEFQLLDRHPWQFHAGGALWPLVQLVVVTPALFVLLLATLRHAWYRWRSDAGGRGGAADDGHFGLIVGTAAVPVLGYFLLGFFADGERVSFHWPLVGYLPLLALAPVVLADWPRWARVATYALAALGLAGVFAFLLVAIQPPLRAALADSRWYPDNFAGWQQIADASREELSRLPPGTPVIADNFMLGAELGFALDRPDIQVLDHPLNHKHGRAPQLQQWRLQTDGDGVWRGGPALLVVEDSARPLKLRLAGYSALCETLDTLPPPRVLNVDHGRKRFLLFSLPARADGAAAGGCAHPALAWIDTPTSGATVSVPFDVAGWAFKDGAGIARVEVTLDGGVVAEAAYGTAMPHVAAYWKISTDPGHPHVGWRARVDARGVAAGPHWLGLRLHGHDGSVEDWPQQRVLLGP